MGIKIYGGGGGGSQGPAGPTGPAGAAATIAPGTVTMLSSGSSPTVTNSGTSSAATFNFGIPFPATSTIYFTQAATGWSFTNTVTTSQTFVSVVIPANTMSANSRMEILADYAITGTTTTKHLTITDSASGLVLQDTSGAFAGSGYFGQYLVISNRGATNSQYIRAVSTSSFGTSGANGVAPIAGTLDFTVARTLVFACSFSATTPTETLKLETYQVRVWTP